MRDSRLSPPTLPGILASASSAAALLLAGLLAGPQGLSAQSDAALVRSALAAAPADLRDDATVLSADGLRELKSGTNDLICLAPNADAEGFSSACYHTSMSPYMERGRALARDGVSDPNERNRIRWEEADAGRLQMPETPATLYVLYGPMSVWDRESGAVEGAQTRWVVYTPWATAETTGLSEMPIPGGPWLMFPGTAGAHIMIMPPPPPA